MRGLHGVTITVLLTATLAACNPAHKPNQNLPSVAAESTAYKNLDSPSMQFLPRQEEAPGWRLQDDPIVLPPAAFQSRLGVDSHHFMQYEALDMTAGQYIRTSGPGFATVEIFRFPDFVEAFGAYSTRRTEKAVALDVPNESFALDHSVHVWRGPFYIRVMGAGGAEGIVNLRNLAAAVARGMPPAPGKPAVFAFFPEQNRLAGSDVYSAEAAFGQPYFRNAFATAYVAGDQRVEAMVLPAPSRAAAEKILNEYRRFFTMNGRLLDQVPNLGEDNFTGEDRFFGRTAAFRLDRFVIAFRGFIERDQLIALAVATDQRILASIRRQLEEQEKAAAKAQDRTEEPPPAPGWMSATTTE